MKEWLDHTIGRLQELAPRRVLEIGCGTGLLLYRLLPAVEHYTAVDFSAHALSQIRDELNEDERRKADLVQGSADQVSLPAGAVDLVVINSVAQYFPSAEYLTNVIERAAGFVKDGGHLWLGDIRSLPLLRAFHTAVQLAQAPADMDAGAFRTRVDSRIAQEGELLLDPAFFEGLTARIPRITDVSIRLKRGHDLNEMTRFRYDVVLTVGGAARPKLTVPETPAPADLAGVRALLASEPDILVVSDVPNVRLTGETALIENVRVATGDVRGLRAFAAGAAGNGFSPEDFHGLDARYDAEVLWARSGRVDRFDVVLRHKQRAPAGKVERQGATPGALFNVPSRGKPGAEGAAEWRTHLRAHLPEYMIPAAFVVLPRLPLTPNGKIDRKALPAPNAEAPTRTVDYVAPASDIEKTISGIWQDLLALPRVGLKENIFDLGANSLLTVQANNKLSQALGRRISLVSMFQFPTVESLAAHLGQKAPAAPAGQSGKDRAEARRQAMQRRAR
jgi:SAM-dependent methyltransferase